MTDETTVKRLRDILETLDESAPRIGWDEYRAFLFVAEKEGVSVKEVQEALGLPQSTTSRVVAQLNGGGHGLVTSQPDPVSRRKVNLHLTDRGRMLLTRLALVLGCLLSGTGEDLMESLSAPTSYFGSIVSMDFVPDYGLQSIRIKQGKLFA